MNTQNIFKVVALVGLLALASTSYAAEDTWTRKADMPTARWGPSTGVVDGKIYAIGGGQNPYGTYLSTVELYDPETDTWTRKADMPTGRTFAGASVVKGKIYVIGGSPRQESNSSIVEVYDTATDTWARKADMLTTRTLLSTSAVNDRIYAIGGNTVGNADSAAVEEYDPATDTWTNRGNMPTPRTGLATSVIDGKIYAIGGIRGGMEGSGFSTTEVYDPATDTWTQKANMPTARGYLSTSVVDGKIYAIGGTRGNWGPVLSTVEEYDPVTDTWAKKPDLPTARMLLPTSVVDGKIYAIGGSVAYWPWTPTSAVEEYDAGLTTLHLGAPEVLAQGSQLHAANGIFFDGQDRLYIACGFGPEIAVMDAETGEILDQITTEVDSPDDLTFGPDGSLYWTDILTGEVGRRTPDGVVTKQFVAPGVNPITFSDDGRLFTALAFLGDALYELDPDLKNPPRFIAENLGMLNGFDFGPDGFLYSPVPFQGKIVRIDVDTGEITPVVAEGIMAPSVKFDSQGRLHTQNYMNGQIVRVDTATGSMEAIASLPFGIDNLAFDSQDRLFCSDAANGAIHQVLGDGTARAVNSGGLIMAGSVAVVPRPDGGESVFAADGWRLREFDGATGKERGVYGPGCNPTSVSADGENLVLSSWLLGNAVQVWNPQTQTTVEDHTDFARPVNAIRFQGDLVVADVGFEAGAARVVRVSAADSTQLVTLAEGLDVPVGLAATEDDLWLSDWGTGTVLQLVADGNLLAPPTVVATGLARPEGLAMGPDGNLLVIETKAGRLSHIDLASGEVTALVEGLKLGLPASPAFPPSHIFTGLAVGSSGTIYITSDVKNQLLAIRVVDPTLVAYWKLDETEGTIASDSAGEHDGLLSGDPQWQSAGGQVAGALELDGIDDCVGTDFVLNPMDGPFSAFAWIKGGAPGQVIISQMDGAGSGDTWLGMAESSGKLMTGLVPPPAGRFVATALRSECIVTDGQWHHVGFVWDGSRRCLYVDGVEVAKDTMAWKAAPMKYADGGLCIGADKTLKVGTFFCGLVDDIRIYNAALSAEEAAALAR